MTIHFSQIRKMLSSRRDTCVFICVHGPQNSECRVAKAEFVKEAPRRAHNTRRSSSSYKRLELLSALNRTITIFPKKEIEKQTLWLCDVMFRVRFSLACVITNSPSKAALFIKGFRNGQHCITFPGFHAAFYIATRLEVTIASDGRVRSNATAISQPWLIDEFRATKRLKQKELLPPEVRHARE